MITNTDILARQAAYAARPFSVRWVDSHTAATFRFSTLDEAFGYVQDQWSRVQKDVATDSCRASNLWQSYIETPDWKAPLSYVLLADDVSSY